MHFVYTCLPYQLCTVKPRWEPEYACVQAQDLGTSLVDMDHGKVWVTSATTTCEQVLYRGWILTAAEYQHLAKLLPLAVRTSITYLRTKQPAGMMR